MDSKQRNAAALRKRINDLTADFLNQYRNMLALAREDEDADYSQSAQKELSIKTSAMAIVTTAQDMSVLVRDLQELWLFGGLDTLVDKKDAELEKEKALKVAEMVEQLVGKMPEAWKRTVEEGKGVQNGTG